MSHIIRHRRITAAVSTALGLSLLTAGAFGMFTADRTQQLEPMYEAIAPAPIERTEPEATSLQEIPTAPSTPAETPVISDEPSIGDGRLHIGGLDLEIAPTTIQPVNGVISPPGSEAYRARLVEGQEAQVFLVHSAGVVGKSLFSDGEPTVSTGDTMTLPDGRTATVVRAEVATKGEDAWGVLSHALKDSKVVVLVTCQPQGPVSSANLVVVAELD